jgi:hypothetical protein
MICHIPLVYIIKRRVSLHFRHRAIGRLFVRVVKLCERGGAVVTTLLPNRVLDLLCSVAEYK